MASTKHPIKTTTNLTPNSRAPPITPPHTFDILPIFHELLSRLDAKPTTTTDVFADIPSANLSSTSTDADLDIGSHYPPDALAPLAPKDLPEEVLKVVKSKIRAALRVVEGLGDVERTCEEQEEEIRELERRIDGQREVLRNLGGVAGSLAEKVT